MELDWWSDTDGCVCVHSEWVIMFSLDLMFMRIKLQVSDCLLPRGMLTYCTFTHTYKHKFKRAENLQDTTSVIVHSHAHKTFLCKQMWPHRFIYTSRQRIYMWHVVLVCIHIYIQGKTNISHTLYSCQRLTFMALYLSRWYAAISALCLSKSEK